MFKISYPTHTNLLTISEKPNIREVNYNTWTFKFDNFPKFQNVISDRPPHPLPTHTHIHTHTHRLSRVIMTRCLRKSICDWHLNLIFFRSLKLPTAWGLGWVKRRKNFPSLSVSYLKLAIFTFTDLLKVSYDIKNTLDLENCFATKMLKFPWVSFFLFFFFFFHF